MNRIDFDLGFEKLLSNSWQFSKNKEYAGLADDWYDKVKYLIAVQWQTVVDKIIDKEETFPAFAKVKKEIDSLRKDRLVNQQKYYKPCKICSNFGEVTMWVSFKYEKDEAGAEVKKVKEKYHDLPGTKYKLKEEKDMFYRFSYHCRCDKGNDLQSARNWTQLSWDEFNELKEYANKK